MKKSRITVLFLALCFGAGGLKAVENTSADFRGAQISNSEIKVAPPLEGVKPAWAEADDDRDPHERGLRLGGPRVGMVYITGTGFQKLQEAVDKAKPGTKLEPYMSHFGWQFEYRMYKTSKGMTALTEVIPVIGGLEQGLALPALTWLIGLRGANGFEFGVGPSVGVDGVSMVVGTGFTFDIGGINIPLNLAVGRASDTTSVSISTGFNL